MDALLPPPRYRVEHRDGEHSPLILAFADGFTLACTRADVHCWRLRRWAERGEVVVVDQETEAVVEAFRVGRA